MWWIASLGDTSPTAFSDVHPIYLFGFAVTRILGFLGVFLNTVENIFEAVGEYWCFSAASLFTLSFYFQASATIAELIQSNIQNPNKIWRGKPRRKSQTSNDLFQSMFQMLQ